MGLRGHRLNPVIGIALLAFSGVVRAQTLTTLFSFGMGYSSAGVCILPFPDPTQGCQSPGGYNPYTLALGRDGNLYGSTQSGGALNDGTIFQVTPSGALTTLYSFGSNAGEGFPNTVLTLGPDGNFYGTTNGSTSSTGNNGTTIFKVTPTGVLTTLYAFGASTGGSYPGTALTLGSDGNFYGVTGGSAIFNSFGMIFKITPAGTLTTLYSFSGVDGADPKAALTVGPDGDLYGTTDLGGPLFSPVRTSGQNGYGTVFKITPAGVLTTLHSFGSTAPSFPDAALTLGPDGNFYGVTANGIIFRVTPAGTATTLYSFSIDIPSPGAALTLGPDGNFYGTVSTGGAYKHGSIFRITPAGVLTTVYSFSNADGAGPQAPLLLGPDGTFYGTTGAGGQYNGGTIFKFTVGGVPALNANGVVNAANYTAPVAPGSIASAFGTFSIPAPTSSAAFPLPASVSGLSVYFGSTPAAPLFFASASQLNLQIPWELQGQTQTAAFVSQNGQNSVTQIVRLATYAPGVFVVNGQTGQGAVLDSGYRLIGPANPTMAGADIVIYCTGLGPVTNQPATGAPALANPLSWTTLQPTVMIGGAQALVLFSGLVPGDVGLYQVNAQVPAAATKGPAVGLTISIGGAMSPIVYLTVQ